MEKIEFERNDGSKGVKYKLVAGDKFKSKFSSPQALTTKQYPAYSLGIYGEGEETLYLQLTKAQYDSLLKMGDIRDKEVEAYSYDSKHRPGCVGVKLVE